MISYGTISSLAILVFFFPVYTACASLNARATTAFWCPAYSRTTSAWSRFHKRAMLSEDANDKMKIQKYQVII